MPNTIRAIEGTLADRDDSFDSLWAQAEHLGRPTIDTAIGGGYRVALWLHGTHDRLASDTHASAKAGLRQVIRKARVLQEGL